ncbi:MAG TPA: ABC transporter substrate-binding protein [Candidatus Polarisedimenticolaceae bacterium]|nr:ABC transporter substrate-binding protein [Candidatus Polarisedimenticolaceae bacterium]
MKSCLRIRNSFQSNALKALIALLMAAWPCDAATKIRVAQPVIAMMYAPLYFGVHQGVFAAEGFELEFMTMRTDLAIAGLATGGVDYIVHGGAALRAAAQGFPLKLIFALDDKTPFWLAARPQIKDVRQLTGKKIGISFPGDTPQIILKRFLRRQGIDPDRDVGYVSGQFSPTALQSLLGGVLDAAILAPPFNVIGAEKGLTMLTFLGESVPDASSSNGIVTSVHKINSTPEQVRRLVRASLKSLWDFRRNKASAIEFLADHFEIPKNIATKAYSNALEILTPDGEITPEKVRQILSMMQDTGKKEAVIVNPASLIDFSFLREAQKELK